MKTRLLLIAALAMLILPMRSRAEITVEGFYNALDPYGDWIEVGDYGYCWHPRGVSAEWRPYTDGQWVYTDAGWTWISEEPHGWATYHYGRWVRLVGHGWVWVPDTQWAPAWVSWRHSDHYVGWAPLPPESRVTVGVSLGGWVDAYFDVGPTAYSFVETRHFGAPRLATVVLPPQQNVTIINETRNVTNINVVNNVVINNGPDYNTIARQAERPIRKLRLEREEVASATAVTKARIEGDAVKMAAPRLAAQPGAKPRKIAQKVERAEVNNGWQDAGPPAKVKPIREKMNAEAKIPENLPPRSVAKKQDRAGVPEEGLPKADATTPKAESAVPGAEAPQAAPTTTPETKRGKGAKSAEKKEAEPSSATPAPKHPEKNKSEPLRFREPQPDKSEPSQPPPTAEPKERGPEPAKTKDDFPQTEKQNEKVKRQKPEAPLAPQVPANEPNAERAQSKIQQSRAEKKIEKSKPQKSEATAQSQPAAQPKVKEKVPKAENQFQQAGKQQGKKARDENPTIAESGHGKAKKNDVNAAPAAPKMKPFAPAAGPGQPAPNVQGGKKQKDEKAEGKKKKGGQPEANEAQ
jgi:hypothetical protein